MRLNVTARHFAMSDSLREHINAEIAKLEKFYDGIIDCNVTMNVEKHRHSVEIAVNVYKHTLVATHQSDNMGASVDGAVEKLKRQLKKLHDKIRSKRIDKESILIDSLDSENTNEDE